MATVPCNLDTATNKYGDIVLQLCKAVPLRILNGKKLGDILVSFTCILPHGQAVWITVWPHLNCTIVLGL